MLSGMDAIPVSHARRLRLAAVALVVAWIFVPGLRDWVPVWLPFLAFAALELHFLVTGLREPRAVRRSRGRSPQEGDVADLGGEEWLEPVLVRVDGRDVWVPAGSEEDEDDDEDDETAAGDDHGHDEVPAPDVPVRRRPRLARVEGIVVLAVLGLALLLFLPDRGWRGLDDADQARTERLLSAEAATTRGEHASPNMERVPVSQARRLRLAAVALIVAWLVVPGLRDWLPIWLPFLALAALELHFLVAGLREPRRPRRRRGRAPQDSDIAELGGDEWLEPVLVDVGGREVWLPSGGEEPDEDGQDDEGDAAPEADEPPPPALRRPRLVRVEGLVALAALGAVALVLLLPDRGWRGLDEETRTRTEALLSAEAARIAGHEARVRCDAEGDAVGIVQHADGLAEIGGTNAFLTPAICYRLHRLAFEDDEGAFSQTARAIAVLAHEAWHLRGERDEGVTNCYAFQSGVALGQRLGLSEETAERMMRQQLVDNGTFARSAPEYLVPGECRNGGRLDLDPTSDRFP